MNRSLKPIHLAGGRVKYTAQWYLEQHPRQGRGETAHLCFVAISHLANDKTAWLADAATGFLFYTGIGSSTATEGSRAQEGGA